MTTKPDPDALADEQTLDEAETLARTMFQPGDKSYAREVARRYFALRAHSPEAGRGVEKLLREMVADLETWEPHMLDVLRATEPAQALLAALTPSAPVSRKPFCETCGADVAEVLCPTCAKWWVDNPPPVEPVSPARKEVERRAWKLEAVARTIESWIEWDAAHRRAEGLTTEDGTHIMSLPVPCWPSHGMFRNWIELFRETAAALSALQPQQQERGLKIVDADPVVFEDDIDGGLGEKGEGR